MSGAAKRVVDATRFAALFYCLAVAGAAMGAPPSGPAHVPAGRFAPLFGLDKGQKDFAVAEFWLDRLPVSEGEFREFSAKNPEWGPGKPPRIYADKSYRKGAAKRRKDSPAVNVSWFAADAYCQARQGRLPTVLEWEYAASFSERLADGSKDPEAAARILRWYADPRSAVSRGAVVGTGRPNSLGIRDLHGLVWEWTADFNSFFVSGDNRSDGDTSSDMFCGNGATGAAERENYAAFMRYAMRSSLRPEFSLENLGFRCAYDRIEGKEGKRK